MRIGVYGGSFNPIHTAHAALLTAFAQRLQLDRVLLIPAGIPPHKAAPDLASGADRLEMCRIAAKGFDVCPMEVLDIEVRREGKSYTADTLSALKETYPRNELFLLMGEDMFLTVEKWRQPERIFAAATICAVPRDAGSFSRLVTHSENLQKEFADFHSVVLNLPHMPISSTEIRAKIKAGEDVSALLPAGIAKYIAQRGLYR